MATGIPGENSVTEPSMGLSDGLLTIQELQITPGMEAAFVDRFAELDVLQLAADAAAGALVDAVMVQRDERFLVVSTWSSDGGIDAWIASSARELIRTELEPFYAKPPIVNRYPICTRLRTLIGRP